MSDAAHDDNPRNTVAVRLPAAAAQAGELDEFLKARGWTHARRFLPKDDDELNDRLCRGEFTTVVFAMPEDAMDMIWAGQGHMGHWKGSSGKDPVEICFASAASNGSNWQGMFRRVEASYASWERRRRRQQTIAGCILTVVALVAMALLFWSRG